MYYKSSHITVLSAYYKLSIKFNQMSKNEETVPDTNGLKLCAGIKEAHRAGRIGSLVGVEGGHSLASSLAVLRMYYSLGARYLTLTHTCHTPWLVINIMCTGIKEAHRKLHLT